MKKIFLASDFIFPADYSVFVISLPRLRKKELRQAALYKIKNVYPGCIDDIELFILKNGAEKNSYIVIAIKKQKIQKKFFLSVLAMKSVAGKKNCNVTFVSDKFAEYAVFEKGVLKKYKVNIFGDSELLKEKEEEFFNADSKKSMLRLDLSCGRKIRIDKSECMLSEKLSCIKLRTIILLIAFLLCCIFFIFSFGRFYSYRKTEDSVSRQAAEETALLEKQNAVLRNSLELLSKEYTDLVSAKQEKCIVVMQIIAENLTIGTTISSLSITGNSFSFEAKSYDALSVLKRFEDSERIATCALHQVKFLGKMEEYSISGSVDCRYMRVLESLSIKEKIEWYEKKLLEIKSRNKMSSEMTVSSVGRYIRSVINDNNCSLQNYQYLQNYNSNELEFSIKCSNRSLFNLFAYLCNDQQLFYITGVQIRSERSGGVSAIFKSTAGRFEDGDISYTVDIDRNMLLKDKEYANRISSFFEIDSAVFVDTAEKQESNEILNIPSWYKFVSFVGAEKKILYIRDEKNGRLLRFSADDKGTMTYSIKASGLIIIRIDGKEYSMEVSK